MNNYYQVDRKGNPVEIYALYEGDVVPEDFKLLWEHPQRFFKPIWDFNENCWREENTTNVLFDAKTSKKVTLNTDCQNYILQGFNYTLNGVEHHFSYDREAQANMSERLALFQNDMITSIKVTARDSNGVPVRLDFDKTQYQKFYLASVKHKEDAISKYRDILCPLVDRCLSIEQVNNVVWDLQINFPIQNNIIINDKNTIPTQIDDIRIAQAKGSYEILEIVMGMFME